MKNKKASAGMHGKGSGKTAGFICGVLIVASIIVPAILSNVYDNNKIMGFTAAFVAAILITSVKYGKHFSVFENDDADRYIVKESIEITERYDKYNYTR